MTKITHYDLWKQVFSIPSGEHYKLTFGSLTTYISHQEGDWQFRYLYSTEKEDEIEQKIEFSSHETPVPEYSQLTRIIHANPIQDAIINKQSNCDGNLANLSKISFQPQLANRSIVAKPHTPFYLPAQESVTIYLSTPVWLAIKIGEVSQPLLEIPSFKLSDTWFGPRPHIGELCYASQFSGRTNFQLLPKRMSRIITPVQIINNGKESLKLEKIAIPTAYLTTYLTDSGELWTSELKVLCERDKKAPLVSTAKNLPSHVANASLISEPREKDASGLISKTLDRLFS
ncbi:hypothetical protein [Aliikangiella sp. IMCC44359]|uniref:hypothetical protein n=1 Tax=Aliikangiella sp. IMCC44359 TaxID=3459125 RepID=UPI00403B3533